MSEIEYRRLPKDLRQPTKVAEDNGWTVRQALANGYRMDSPGKTQTFYVPFKTNAAQSEARNFMKKITRAVLNEDTPQSKRVLQELNDPAEANSVLECSHCGVTFMTLDGYNAHLMPCVDATRARLAAERKASKAITQPGGEEPSEGLSDIPAEAAEDPSKSSGSGKIGNKEEDSMGGSVSGHKRGPYNRRTSVKPGISRAIYEAMRARTWRKDEALSVYANAIGEMVEEKIGALSDAESRLAQILEVLGVDPESEAKVAELNTKVEELTAENERVTGNLKSLKELLSGI